MNKYYFIGSIIIIHIIGFTLFARLLDAPLWYGIPTGIIAGFVLLDCIRGLNWNDTK